MAGVADPDVRHARFTLDEYHRMVSAGVFQDGARVELIEGEVLAMSPKSRSHDEAVAWLNERLVLALAGRFRIRPQSAVTFPPQVSEPEPDLAVVPLDAAQPYHPSEAALVIEVSKSSLRYDRARKTVLYARAGIPEYWIVDLEHERLEVRTRPDDDGYLDLRTLERGDAAVPACAPDLTVGVAELFDAAFRFGPDER